ncbi:MAG TPA: hypothetical protein PKC72_03925 [Chitinophagaceae bacterium]|nr:hypothetical protein [Chitinophagaceae bacterium]
MQDRFNSDFEQFVKQNADQYRMFPSEKVWKGIHSSLHTRKWWYGLGILLLLITSGIVTWVMVLTPSDKKSLAEAKNIKSPAIVRPGYTTSKRNITGNYEKVVVIPAKSKIDSKNTSLKSEYFAQKNLFLKDPATGYDNQFFPDLKQPGQIEETGAAIANINFTVTAKKGADVITQKIPSSPGNIKQTFTTVNDPVVAIADHTEFSEESNITLNPEKSFTLRENRTTVAGEMYPLTIESVLNTYKYTGKKRKLTWQMYFVPTISYRKLKENKAFIEAARANNSIATYTWVSDVNSVVKHKPDLGFEVGFNTFYPLTKRLRLTGGLQFNVSKYDIRAYRYPGEVATIALNNGTGANSVSTITTYRNLGGSADTKSNWLRNLYFSASAPIGAEFLLVKNKKSYVGVGSTIQPTYILGNQAYLLSTDYKNYAEVPSLIRRWNVNTGLEIFAGFNIGNTKLRVGPQARYQLLSSFRKEYPVKEQLFDFGLKVGITLK